MKKIAITALLGLLLTPAYAENQQGFDQDEIYQQIQLMSEYIENELSNIVLVMQTWPAYMNRCYAGNAARLCAYRDIYFSQIFEFVMKQSGDRQRVVPLNAQTRAWIRQNPRLSEQAAAEITAIIREAGL